MDFTNLYDEAEAGPRVARNCTDMTDASLEYGSLRGPRSALAVTEVANELFWWHFAVIVPTVAFKYLFVRRLSFTTGLQTILESMGSGFERYLNFLLLATVDILEVTLLVGAWFVVGRLLLRIPAKGLVFTSVLLCLIMMGANQLSLLLVASLVTVDTFAITLNWAMEHPQIVGQSLGWSQLVFLLFAVVWSSFFAILPSRSDQLHKHLFPFSQRSYVFLIKAILVSSAIGCLARARMSADFPLVLRGYWSSTVISFLKLDAPKLATAEVPPLATIQSDYQRLVYPQGLALEPSWLADVPVDKRVPRHIVIVVLETAPRQYYPLTDNPALPTFHEMSRHAMTSLHHYAMSPYTWWNIASIASGNYFLQKGKGIFDYGEFSSDSIGSVLEKHGYTATFIDSFKLGWAGTTGFWRNLGFSRLLDTENDPIPFDRDSYSILVDKERQSFARALSAIVDAEGRQRKAVVMLGTTLGHHPWPARPGTEGRSNEEKLLGIATLFDEIFGEFLRTLRARNLGEQVLIVVTGDHGFRMRTEFESVGLKAEHGDVAFNVPFLMYGPGLFDKEIRLPYVTSHVDLAPTLLMLTGVKEESWLHHGMCMLDQRLRHRVTFMMNTNLSPVSGFHLNGCHYTFNELTGAIQVKESSSNADYEAVGTQNCYQDTSVLSDKSVKSIIEAANKQFQTALACFEHRHTLRAKMAKY